ncbi:MULTISPECIES: tetratricopeptide repeat protein [Corallococcus]|uniref:tetratricopeptide repeat protein n=1 Tax=Corallococcus TaxID=83461 RepID=UPI0011C3ABEC|nr:MULTISPECIES: tetratricopeptide repeat protein [Corallococcus]NPC74131.1 tetratricopeptide repeat protein [Corallococcus exiguus]NPD28118.1 tetratricopeptide repeat protein [Corallococcus exiguus]NRD49583.1 tetratricopeptide repeat protein [Corallococcus exiguus]
MRSLIRSRRSEPKALSLALALALGTPFPAVAAETTATAADDQAREKFSEGNLAYDLGEFDRALKAFSEAYRLKPLPAFLFNIAQCHRQLNNPSRASFFYRRYLSLSQGEPANADVVRELVAEMDAKARVQEEQRRERERFARDRELQKAREQAALAEARANEARLAANPSAAREKNGASEALAMQVPDASVKTEAGASKPWTRRWYVWAGAGAVALLAGGAVWLATAPNPRDTTLGTVGR